MISAIFVLGAIRAYESRSRRVIEALGLRKLQGSLSYVSQVAGAPFCSLMTV